VLAPSSELQRRFADATLICIGSPASNHLSRILNRYAIHRYNLSKDHYEEIEKFIGKAWSIGTRQPPKRDAEEEVRAADERPHDFFTAPRDQPQFDYKELEGFFANSLPEVKWFRHSVFGGGFIDPTYSKRVRGLNQDRDRDFAIITLAQNPFREKNDGEFPAVILAGYHLPGTCYTLHEHIWSNRGQFFENHPYGGVLRVDLEPLAETHKSFYTFYERMENFVVQWDDESDYNEGELLTAVAEISKKLPDTCHLLLKEAQRLRTFVHHLITPGSEHDMGSETETSLPVSAAQPRRVDRAR